MSTTPWGERREHWEETLRNLSPSEDETKLDKTEDRLDKTETNTTEEDSIWWDQITILLDGLTHDDLLDCRGYINKLLRSGERDD